MAWRLCEEVVRGEIDNRIHGSVTGRIWLAGRARPVVLDLKGNAWRDLAGSLLRFSNPKPDRSVTTGASLAEMQRGRVGDITASRKVKQPECSIEEMFRLKACGMPFPWHWANALYLEWFSERNGRVVIESSRFELEVEPGASWEMAEEDESAQRFVNAVALTEYMDRLSTAACAEAVFAGEEVDDDTPQSAAEAEADAWASRMDLLLDRVGARLEREGDGSENLDRINEEERERLRRERGEPEPEAPTAEQEAERAAWVAEMNGMLEEDLADPEAKPWNEGDGRQGRHPLVKRCSDLSLRIHRDVKAAGWIPDDAQGEHPVREILQSCRAAGAKLAGALHDVDEDGWPPEKLFAGDALVRLKKARDWLRDAIRGLESADDENIVPLEWRIAIRRETSEILGQVQEMIYEVRQVLADDEEPE